MKTIDEVNLTVKGTLEETTQYWLNSVKDTFTIFLATGKFPDSFSDDELAGLLVITTEPKSMVVLTAIFTGLDLDDLIKSSTDLDTQVRVFKIVIANLGKNQIEALFKVAVGVFGVYTEKFLEKIASKVGGEE